MNEEDNNNSGFWFGMLLGGVLGSIVGYLYNSGDKKQAIEEIKEKGKILLENLGEFKEQAVEKGKKVEETVKTEVGEVVKEIKEAKKGMVEETQGVPQAAKEAIERVEKAAEEAVKNISDSVKSSNTRIDPRKKGFGKSFFRKGDALVKE